MKEPSQLASSEIGLDAALTFVRSYSIQDGDTYDVNGVIHLLLAALDNLTEHMIEGDWEQLLASADEDQLRMLGRIGKFVEQSQQASP
jgi:hypothetical protein